MKSRIMYVELKTGHSDNGPARIGRVEWNRTGKTLSYDGSKFRSLKGSGVGGNYFDIETREQYWISGCKKKGEDRHRCGYGPVEIDDDVREEYWTEVRNQPERAGEKLA